MYPIDFDVVTTHADKEYLEEMFSRDAIEVGSISPVQRLRISEIDVDDNKGLTILFDLYEERMN